MNFTEVFDEAPVGVLIVSDSDDKIVYANRQFLRDSGYTSSDLDTKEYRKMLVEKKPEKLSAASSQKADRILLRKDGEEVPVHVRAVATKTETGEAVTLHYVSFQEISRDSQEEKMNSVFFEAIMDNFVDRIYFKDEKSRFLRVNATFLNDYRLKSQRELVGKTDFDVFSEEHAREAFEDEQQILKTQKPIFNKEEKETFRNDESEAWVITSKLPLYNDNRELIGTFGVSRDITQLKKAEMQAREG